MASESPRMANESTWSTLKSSGTPAEGGSKTNLMFLKEICNAELLNDANG